MYISTAPMLFYFLQEKLTLVAYFSSFQDPVLNGASVVTTLQFRVSAVLLQVN
jgi:hypothetical protein